MNNVSGLKTNPNGSLIIWLASSLPKNVIESKWLQTHSGKVLSLNLRMYVSKKDVHDGKRFPAPIEEKK